MAMISYCLLVVSSHYTVARPNHPSTQKLPPSVKTEVEQATPRLLMECFLDFLFSMDGCKTMDTDNLDATRNPLARSDVTIDNCESLQFTFEPDGLSTIIVWRDKPRTRPADPSKRLRDLGPGDVVVLPGGERRTFSGVEIFR